MQDSRTPPFSENAYSSSVSRRKKKSSAGKQPLSHFPVTDDAQPSRNKASKRNHRQPEIPNSDSLPGDEYRALRRRYLLLEEESSVLENELKAVEVEVKALEDDKLHLLDQLVVLEGLVDPSGPILSLVFGIRNISTVSVSWERFLLKQMAGTSVVSFVQVLVAMAMRAAATVALYRPSSIIKAVM